MIKNPKLLEINTRVWIKKFDAGKNLSTIPPKQFDYWKELGYDLVWFMGIWNNNKDAVKKYCFEPELIANYNNALKDWTDKDIIGSPYSIDKYEINPNLGTLDDLKELKAQLNKKGIKLILDFVSNHFSASSSLIWSKKEIFLPADEFIFNNDPFTFYKSPANDNEYLAHGRDPLFPPWKDTAQVNFYSNEARKFLTDILLQLTDVCDGVRCDMAMLPLNNVFYNTWIGVIKKYGFERPEKEFWEEAISDVKKKRKDFLFIAETYWDLEWQLQKLGFDYTYDKRLTDRLVGGDVHAVRDHLRADLDYQQKSVRFLENHDEERAIVKFGRERSLAAALIISTLPGMSMFFDGQCDGKRVKLPLQLGREPEEKQDEKVKEIYKKIFSISKRKIFKEGNWKLLEPIAAGDKDISYENLLAWQWNLSNETIIVVVNYNNFTSRCRIKFDVISKSDSIILFDIFNDVQYQRSISEINDKGLFIELKSFGSHVFLIHNS
jgi:glycosidase